MKKERCKLCRARVRALFCFGQYWMCYTCFCEYRQMIDGWLSNNNIKRMRYHKKQEENMAKQPKPEPKPPIK